MNVGMLVLYAVEAYVGAGLCGALGFVVFGIVRVARMPATAGARILIFPGVTLLWPYVLVRWLKSGPLR